MDEKPTEKEEEKKEEGEKKEDKEKEEKKGEGEEKGEKESEDKGEKKEEQKGEGKDKKDEPADEKKDSDKKVCFVFVLVLFNLFAKTLNSPYLSTVISPRWPIYLTSLDKTKHSFLLPRPTLTSALVCLLKNLAVFN